MTKDAATMNRNRSPYDVLLVLALLAAPAAGCGDTPAMGEQRMLWERTPASGRGSPSRSRPSARNSRPTSKP